MTAGGGYPRTIEDGSGLRLTFVGRRRDERGDVLDVRNEVAPGAGPPMHVHHIQEESLTVERGRLGYQLLGEAEQHAGPGETVTFAPGVPHRFWNAGDEQLVCTGWARPPHNLEYFLTELYASTRRHGGKRPGLLDGAWLSHRYRDEFESLEIPAPIRRFVFPVLARLAGPLVRRRYAEAPEPARR
jgi:quercetin dioxygenase-like cupin family protein